MSTTIMMGKGVGITIMTGKGMSTIIMMRKGMGITIMAKKSMNIITIMMRKGMGTIIMKKNMMMEMAANAAAMITTIMDMTIMTTATTDITMRTRYLQAGGWRRLLFMGNQK